MCARYSLRLQRHIRIRPVCLISFSLGAQVLHLLVRGGGSGLEDGFAPLAAVSPQGSHQVEETLVAVPDSSGGRPTGKVGPSLLAADLSNLEGEAQRVLTAGADFIHLDVMDGNYVRGAFSFGPMVVQSLRSHLPHAFLDVHLYVTDPGRYVEELAEAGATRLTFHFEAVTNHKEIVARARSLGLLVGLALAPSTPVDEQVLSLARFFDSILVLTVSPGFGGQAFMPEVLPKLEKLRAAFPGKALEVDGGVNAETVVLAAAAGANEAVAGTAVFRSADPASLIRHMRSHLAGSKRS
eukprot:TRINITY_DN54751_c0_g1_i1.p1 TRINITY_DN54751_c0_g1~~TRINITY_DN54751_c0_g1_i1.p1  ORF type:complete len:296 (-),score=43.16 TRINITY_DN54751_c0_g1_i1:32-919(-)